MRPDRLPLAFRAFHLTLGLVLFHLSVDTVADAFRDASAIPAGLDPHAVVIGTLEATAAVLFLFRRTFRVGAAGLLGIVGAAAVVHLLQGRIPAALFVYLAGVARVWAHGPQPWTRETGAVDAAGRAA